MENKDDSINGKAKGNEENHLTGEVIAQQRDINQLLYTVEETPPFYLCILLGFQHYLTAISGIISVPIILREPLCLDEDTVGLSELMGTIFFVSGISTILQSTFGIRLPIVQGGTLALVAPAVAILAQPQWECPYTKARLEGGIHVNFTSLGLPEVGSEEHRTIWQARVREIQGAIIVSSLAQVVIGCTGIMGFMLRFIGPLSIAPTIALIALSLFNVGSDNSSPHWWIAIMTMFFITLFSQYMKNINIPCFKINKKTGCSTVKLPIFSLFPILLALICSWIICAILTVTNVFPNDPSEWGYNARTDIKTQVLEHAQWFRIPYPGQWGMPTVSVFGVCGMLPGVLASMVESIGDYYTCARLSGAPPPPIHAVNRGVMMEGIGCILAGAWGSGNGTTSYSENVGAIGITKVGSRRVIQVGGSIMILLGCLGKFGALFVMIPTPVIGGMQMIMLGMVVAVGLSNLQYVDLNSSRNIFILGTSMYFGISLPEWMTRHDVIHTGSTMADQTLTILLSTSMFVGGSLGFILDNTIPGTDEERGIRKWRQTTTDTSPDTTLSREVEDKLKIYDIPLIQKYLDKVGLFRYIPICPRFNSSRVDSSKDIDDTQTETHIECDYNSVSVEEDNKKRGIRL